MGKTKVNSDSLYQIVDRPLTFKIKEGAFPYDRIIEDLKNLRATKTLNFKQEACNSYKLGKLRIKATEKYPDFPHIKMGMTTDEKEVHLSVNQK